MNDLDEYQKRVMEHVEDHEGVLQCLTLGLGEEAGEVVGAVTKLWRYHGKTDVLDLTEQERDHILEELGDITWYVAALAARLGGKLSTVAHLNHHKLQYRRDIRKYEKIFRETFPDADPDYTNLYWEKVRKCSRLSWGGGGHVYLIYPKVLPFSNPFMRVLISKTDKELLTWLLSKALEPSEIYKSPLNSEEFEEIGYLSKSEE